MIIIIIFLNFNNIEMEQKMDQGMEPKVEQQSETPSPQHSLNVEFSQLIVK